MLSSLFSPSRRRLARMRRAWQRPLIWALVACSAVPALAAGRPVQKRVTPEYPVLALRMRISGVVTVTATVAADGRVTAVKAEHGNSLLIPAAVSAVQKWKFAPAAAPSTETVNVTFEMGS
jgi:TonB family protein